MKAVTQATTHAATSVAVSLIASVLASFLLRRLIFLAQRAGTETQGEQHAPVIVVMPITLIGNSIGSQVFLPQRKRPFALLGNVPKVH